jgi:RNA polymerase sigma factor (sigma-70 family)
MAPGDRDLVERLGRGDHGAFEALYRRHKDRLYRHALVQSGGRASIAEEVVQDVFLSLFEGKVSPDRNVGGYLLASVRNRALNAVARRESHAGLGPEGAALLVAQGGAPEGELRRKDEARVLADALLGLSPEQREVVLLRTFEGLSWKDVADLTATSVPTASSRYRAALERLRTTCRSLSHA